jgi:hypothetical protein
MTWALVTRRLSSSKPCGEKTNEKMVTIISKQSTTWGQSLGDICINKEKIIRKKKI